MSAPRNRAAFEKGQAIMAEIEAIMSAASLGTRMTWKVVLRKLSRPLSERQIQTYMARIRAANAGARFIDAAKGAVGALPMRHVVTHADTHGIARNVVPAAAHGLLASRDRSSDGTIPQHDQPADRLWDFRDRAPRTPRPGIGARTRPAAPDKFEGFRDPDFGAKDAEDAYARSLEERYL
jgi:hypothetical protein